MSTVISAKVPKDLRLRAKRYGVKIGEVVRRALEEEVRKIEQERLSRNLDELSVMLRDRLTKDDIVRAVRSSRDER